MKILIMLIVMDVLIFALGSIYADQEVRKTDTSGDRFHMDRYGYYWKMGE